MQQESVSSFLFRPVVFMPRTVSIQWEEAVDDSSLYCFYFNAIQTVDTCREFIGVMANHYVTLPMGDIYWAREGGFIEQTCNLIINVIIEYSYLALQKYCIKLIIFSSDRLFAPKKGCRVMQSLPLGTNMAVRKSFIPLENQLEA